MRLIDADALEPTEMLVPMGNGNYECTRIVYMDDIDNMPTIEPEQIVRCKDCRKREVCRTSTVWAVAPGDDWYCADAERRTDE